MTTWKAVLIAWPIASVALAILWGQWCAVQKRKVPANRKLVPTITVVEHGGCKHVTWIER